jgi:lambda family phage portal protein
VWGGAFAERADGGVPVIDDPEVAALIDGPRTDVAMVGGAFEGAARFDRSLAMWGPLLNSADHDILPEKDLLDARVRDMVRNDAYVQSATALHKDNIVGSMFMLNAKPETSVLRLDEVWEQEFQEEVEAYFTLAAESPNNWFDAARTNTLTGMVRLAVGVYTAGGELLATAEWLNKDKSRPFSTAIQMIELERLSTPPEVFDLNGNVRGGIRFDNYGAPQSYFIRLAHPTDYDAGLAANTWREVARTKPWGRLQVIHIHEQSRIDQSRGVSEMVAALKEMKVTKKFRDITLQNAVVNATYAASIESDLPSEAVFAALGAGGRGNGIGESIGDYGTQYLAAVAKYIGDNKSTYIDGVKIPHLFPGTKLQLRPAGTPGGVGQDFEKSLLRYIAANLGVSYEELSRDYSSTNYSSAKAAMASTGKFMSSRKRMVADRFASAVYRLWLEEAINNGRLSTMKYSKCPNWYEGMNADAYSQSEWIGANQGQIDELKETQAMVLRLKYKITTYAEEQARLGKKWRKTFQQAAREKKVMEELDIVVVESNAINAASGAPREAGSTGDDEEKKAA